MNLINIQAKQLLQTKDQTTTHSSACAYTHPGTQFRNQLRQLSNQDLLNCLRNKAKQEQQLTLEVIDLISEVNQRHLHLEMSYGSLFDFVTKELGYDASSAMRRIQASRLIESVPSARELIKQGELSLSVASQAQSFFNYESRERGESVSAEEKRAVLEQLKHKSAR